MIEDLKPIDGRPSEQNRIDWLKYASRLKCAYLIIVRLPEPAGKSIPRIVWDSIELFDQLSDIQSKHTCFTLEIYNPNLDHGRQIETPLKVDSIARPKPARSPHDELLFRKSLPKLDKQAEGLTHTSQFDFELWFHLGQLQGAEYMIIAVNTVLFPLYYPVYSNRKDLLESILNTRPGYDVGALALYRLDDSFKYQYMNGAFSTQVKPGKFYGVREETLPVFVNDPELEGFRRRLMDFFCFSQLTGPDSELCLGSALELIGYGKKLTRNKRAYATALLMKIYDSVPHKGLGSWRLLPYSLLLSYYRKPMGGRQEIVTGFYNDDPGVRGFGMSCHSLFRNDFESIKSAIRHYCHDGYELRGLLHLLWQSRASSEEKTQFIREQLKVDKTAVKCGWNLPSPDMIKELYLYLKPHTMPNPFAGTYNRLREYKDKWYHNDHNIFYALHTDPNPRLRFARERRICERKAEKGDLQSILNLAAYYYWCEGEHGDYPRALKWIRKGVKLNHPTAICLLGCAYWRGNGVKINPATAIDLITKSAQMGYATAYYYLSQCYEYADPPVLDYVKAYAYLLVSRWTLEDFPEFNDIDERISYVYRSKLHKDEGLYQEALELARKIVRTLIFVENEPALYMGEACQKELAENWIRWKWNRSSDCGGDLPIKQL